MGVGGEEPRKDVLLAVALGSRRQDKERRLFPDRRSGIDRRKAGIEVPSERRSGSERREVVRRKADRQEGATLLQKAHSRLSTRLRRRAAKEDPGDGLR